MQSRSITVPAKAKAQSRSKSPAPQSYHHGDLRNALIEAALASLRSNGNADFSLSDLSRRLGVTPAAAYKHFADKGALIACCAELGFARLSAAFEAASPIEKPAKNATAAKLHFRAIAAAYLSFGIQEPALFSLMFGALGAEFRRSARARSPNSTSFGYLVRALRALHRYKVIAREPAQHELWLAWSAIHGATHLATSNVSELVSKSDAPEVICEFLIRSM